jgi:hypothetical protein
LKKWMPQKRSRRASGRPASRAAIDSPEVLEAKIASGRMKGATLA